MDKNETSTEQLVLTKRRSYCVLCIFLTLYLLAGMIKTIQAPFYPQEAISKNLTAKEYGFVSGSYDITQCLISIPMGMLVSLLGSKRTTVAGTILTGLCMLAFGFLKYCNSGVLFFTLSLVLRILEGFGKSFVHQGALNTVFTSLSKYSTLGITLLESAYGVGLVISPVLGGLLFDFGGFLLPYLSLGIVFMLTLPFSIFVIPAEQGTKNLQEERSLNWQVLRVAEVWFGFLSVISAMISMSFFTTHLGPHLETLHLNATYRGLVFYPLGLFYAGSSPLWGKLCVRGLDSRICISIAALFSITGISLAGPAPFLPFQTSLPLIISGVVLTGVGIGGCVPISYVYNRQACDKKGIPNNTNSNAMLTGLYLTASGSGSFLGSAIGGVVHDLLGFRGTSMIPLGLNALTLMLGFVLYAAEKLSKNVEEEENLTSHGETK